MAIDFIELMDRYGIVRSEVLITQMKEINPDVVIPEKYTRVDLLNLMEKVQQEHEQKVITMKKNIPEKVHIELTPVKRQGPTLSEEQIRKTYQDNLTLKVFSKGKVVDLSEKRIMKLSARAKVVVSTFRNRVEEGDYRQAEYSLRAMRKLSTEIGSIGLTAKWEKTQ